MSETTQTTNQTEKSETGTKVMKLTFEPDHTKNYEYKFNCQDSRTIAAYDPHLEVFPYKRDESLPDFYIAPCGHKQEVCGCRYEKLPRWWKGV